jgi:hypothetical protein
MRERDEEDQQGRQRKGDSGARWGCETRKGDEGKNEQKTTQLLTHSSSLNLSY